MLRVDNKPSIVTPRNAGEREEGEEQVLAKKKMTDWDSVQVRVVGRNEQRHDFIGGRECARFATTVRRVA